MGPADLTPGLQRLAAWPRLLVYDVPREDAPHRAGPTTPFVAGGDSWWRFVDRRRALDDGEDLNLMVSLRGLRTEERLLAVSWGVAFANSFLLIEPYDPWLDLTSEAGIAALQQRTSQTDPDALLRAAYADWVYWLRDAEGNLESRRAALDVSDQDATLWQTLWQRLPQTFSAADFLSWTTLMQLREAELFTGGREVARAIVPFLTRLGLPVLYDAHHVLQAVRQLVNAGLASALDPEDGSVYRGPERPLPPDIPDERLALMLR